MAFARVTICHLSPRSLWCRSAAIFFIYRSLWPFACLDRRTRVQPGVPMTKAAATPGVISSSSVSDMNRRRFLSAATSSPILLSAQGEPSKPAPRKALMKAGTQHDSSDETLRVLAAFGVEDICSALPSERMDPRWSVEDLTRLRERVESHGIKL